MSLRAAAVVLALTLNPALLHAQDVVLTVNVPSAEVHQGPSVATPIIGHVPRGTVLPVARNLGSWVSIAWPEAPDGVGFVHVTRGRLGPPSAGAPSTTMSPRASATSAGASAPLPARTPVEQQVAPRRHVNVTPASHIIGVGGLVASMNTFGATARTWRNNRIGLQFGFTRDAMTSSVGAGRVTSMQFEPGVVYALLDKVTDYVWIRPYVGSVVSFRHQTLKSPFELEDVSDNGIGFRMFGGSELTFAALPQFGLSADVGYQRFPTPFPGFESDAVSVSIAGHWYFK